MKKTLVLIAIAGMMVLFSNEIYAQNGKGKSSAPKTNWVDANGDGVCDSYTGTPKQNKGAVKPNFVDADGDGICDNNKTGTPRGNRANFVDADGDGVCDNAGQCQPKLDGSGSSNGKKMMRGKGKK